MDARAKSIREVLHTADQYLVPFFQRQYSWTQRHWERLRDDLWTLLEDSSDSRHFMGPLVCTPVDRVPGEVPAYQLIDGQQRLTTLTLLLTALRDVASKHGLGNLADEITEDYLLHKRKPGLERYKVIPRAGDREALVALVEGDDAGDHRRRGIYRAWSYFRKWIDSLVEKEGDSVLPRLLAAVIDRLSLVVITIDGENPYEIFESLNSTGLPLEESDLIRNYLFMQVPLTGQESFNVQHWQPFERLFEETDEDPAISPTPFYRSYLMRNGQYSKAKATFVDFKKQNREADLSPQKQVAALASFARYEVMLRRPHTAPTPVRKMLAQVQHLEITTAHPLIMYLMELRNQGKVDEAELIGCLSDLASFVLRRSICGESTRAYGVWFVEAITEINSNPRDDLRQYLLRRGWPSDDVFGAKLLEFPLYRREDRKCRLMLVALEEAFAHKERVELTELEIEHVMPQKLGQGPNGAAWREVLGENWRAVHDALVHTLGNLTLSGYNETLGNRAYLDKRRLLHDSKLGLNGYFSGIERWDAEAIRERGRHLGAKILEIWPRPEGGPAYSPSADEAEGLIVPEEEQEELLFQFWEGLLEDLSQTNEFTKLPDATVQNRLRFVIGHSGFVLRTVIDLREKTVDVALRCEGSRARSYYERFYADRESIENELGDDLTWQVRPGVNRTHITSRLRDIDLLRKENWPDYRERVVKTLSEFRRVFVPRIGSATS